MAHAKLKRITVQVKFPANTDIETWSITWSICFESGATFIWLSFKSVSCKFKGLCRRKANLNLTTYLFQTKAEVPWCVEWVMDCASAEKNCGSLPSESLSKAHNRCSCLSNGGSVLQATKRHEADPSKLLISAPLETFLKLYSWFPPFETQISESRSFSKHLWPNSHHFVERTRRVCRQLAANCVLSWFWSATELSCTGP